MVSMEVLCQDFHVTRFNQIKVNKAKLLLLFFFTRGLLGPQKLRQKSQMTEQNAVDEEESTCWSSSPPCGLFEEQQRGFIHKTNSFTGPNPLENSLS